MSGNPSLAKDQVNSNRAAVNASIKPSPLLVYVPSEGLIYAVPKKASTSFENECRLWEGHRESIQNVNRVYQKASDKKKPKAIEEAAKQAETAYKKFQGDLQSLSKLSGNNSMLEVVVLHGTAVTANNVNNAKKAARRYLRKKKLSALKGKGVKAYTLKRGKPTKSDSFIRKNKNGRYKIDTNDLKKQLKEIEPSIKADFSFFKGGLDKSLGDWAHTFNNGGGWDLSMQAQAFRAVADAGGQADWNPKAKKVNASLYGRGDISLVSAGIQSNWYLPSKAGLVWMIGNKPMGAFRLYLGISGQGGVGASLVGQAGISIDMSGKKSKLKGIPKKKAKAPIDPVTKLPLVSAHHADLTNSNGASAELEAFAGAKADVSLSGAAQWRKPVAYGNSTKHQFEDFCKVAPGIGVSAGIGGNAQVFFQYDNGRLVGKISASVCVGVGGKGFFLVEINGKLIAEFCYWLAHQLVAIGFEYLPLIEGRTFEALSKLQVMAIGLAKDIAELISDLTLDTAVLVDREYKKFIAAAKRDYLAESLAKYYADKNGKPIKLNPNHPRHSTLLHATPEAKGMMLYLLTRHNFRDDAINIFQGQFSLDDRRKAIIVIGRSIRDKVEYNKIMWRIHQFGEKNTYNQQAIYNFLGGAGSNADFKKYQATRRLKNYYYEWLEIKNKLKNRHAVGQAFFSNDSIQYAVLAGQDHPMYLADNTIWNNWGEDNTTHTV